MVKSWQQTCQVYWFFNPIYRSPGWKNIYTGLKKKLLFKFFSSDFDLVFVWNHCLIIGSLQSVTNHMLFDN